MRYLLLGMCLSMALFIVGCSKKSDNSPTPQTSNNTPAISSVLPSTTTSLPSASTAANPVNNSVASNNADNNVSVAHGEQVFNQVCTACHGTGVAGAPKVGDKAAWGPRIAQGDNTLFQHAKNGFTGKSGTMPPKGGNPNLSDNDIKSAIAYMKSKVK